jgi:hypothetical protein
VLLKTSDFYIRKIFNTPECYRTRGFSLKIQEACKVFLVNLEDYLRFSYWKDLYHYRSGYVCFEIFKDYYDNDYFLDKNKLFNIEEDIWLDYSKNIIMNEDYNINIQATSDSYNLGLNLFDEGLDMEIVQKPQELPKSPVVSPPKKFITIKDVKKSPKKKKPLMKDLIIKFTKRENVDKKIFRKFRKYLKEFHEELPFSSEFWETFINLNLLPPVKFYDKETFEHVNHKSFNTTYSMWLFSHKGSLELYENFLNAKEDEIMVMFIDTYKNEVEKEELRLYILNLAYIYASKELDDNLSKASVQAMPDDVGLVKDLDKPCYPLNISFENFDYA